MRKVTDLPARPDVAEAGVDAAGNALLLLGHAGGLDLYRVDPHLPSELPARGSRLYKPEAGERVRAAAFDTVADTAERAGGRVGNKGVECAEAALEMVSLLGKLPGP